MVNLAGKRIVITRPKKQSQKFVDMIVNEEATPICFPVIEISPVSDSLKLDAVLQNLASYDWLILTSVNGVAAVWERFKILEIHTLPETLKISCIGPKTAAALEAKGVQPDFVPDEYIAEAILPGLGDLKGLNVLMTRADLARLDLPEAITAGGGIAEDICAYRTLPAELDKEGLAEIIQGVDILTFTSPSTVENFFRVVEDQGLNPLNLPGNPITACIGPITARAAESKGFQVAVLAQDYTVEGLLKALQHHFRESVDE